MARPHKRNDHKEKTESGRLHKVYKKPKLERHGKLSLVVRLLTTSQSI